MKGRSMPGYGLRVAAVLVLMAAAACTPAGREPAAAGAGSADWPVFRGDPALSGVSGAGIPDRLSLLWSFDTGALIISSPVLGFGCVYIGSTNGKVYALGQKEGRPQWEFSSGDDIEASPLILGDSVYIGNLSGEFFALDARSGSEVWRYRAENSIYGSANWAPGTGGGAATILVGSYDNRLYGLNAASGELRWSYETDNYINGTPATDGRIVVFGGCDEILHVVSVSDGVKLGEVWTGSYIPGSAALKDGRAYLGHYGNKLICIDVEAGKILWEYEDELHGGPFFASPAVGAERVVIGSRDQSLHCVDRETGEGIWTFRTRHEIDGSAVIAGDKVVFGSIDGRLYVVSLKDGRELWSYEIGAAILSSPAVSGGLVVIAAEDGRVYTFGEGQ